jgi:hypothetical protein
MKNYNFEPINDAYQLVEGAKIKGKKQEELFELGAYDANKRGYELFPFEDGLKFQDFKLLITEKELMQHYLIEDVKVTAPMNRLSLDEAA